MAEVAGTFLDELEAFVGYFREELSISHSEIIGGLDIMKFRLLAEVTSDDDDEPAMGG